jgi:hypothetical protein
VALPDRPLATPSLQGDWSPVVACGALMCTSGVLLVVAGGAVVKQLRARWRKAP